MSYWENSLHMMQVEVKGEESPSMICLCDSVLLHKYTEQIGIDICLFRFVLLWIKKDLCSLLLSCLAMVWQWRQN